jgi:hypothetical protein
VEKTKGNSGLRSADVQNDAPEKDERGIPENVSAESHAYRNFAGVGTEVVGEFEHHAASEPPFSLLQWRVL